MNSRINISSGGAKVWDASVDAEVITAGGLLSSFSLSVAAVAAATTVTTLFRLATTTAAATKDFHPFCFERRCPRYVFR